MAYSPPKSRDHDARTLGDSLSASSTLQPDISVENAEFDQRLRDNLKIFGDGLQGREREIFRRRLLNEDPVTLVTLANRFGVTRERARQLEFRLKTRIRDYLQQELGDAVRQGRAAA